MKFGKRGLIGAAIAAALFLGWSAAARSATVTVEGPAGPVQVGDTFIAVVTGSGFDSLDGGGLDFQFSSDLLELLGTDVDSGWNFMPDSGLADNAAGTLTGVSFNVFPSARVGSFPIASLQFKAKASGLAEITVAENPIFVFGAGGEWVPVAFVGTSVDITSAVPEPSSALMLIGGAVALFAARRRSIAA